MSARPTFRSRVLFGAFVSVSMLASLSSAQALSQITDEDGTARTRDGIVSVPLPPVPGAPAAATPSTSTVTPTEGSTSTPADAEATEDTPSLNAPDPDAEDESTDEEPGAAKAPPSDLPPAEILYGDSKLPAPVRDLRRKLIEVAKTGDIEKLRPLMEPGAEGTAVTTVQDGEDPITILKNASGDGNGVEILAILLETLEAGSVHLDPGGENEIFVWPYFTQVNLETLTPPQLVELFELVTAGDYQRMVGNGSYDFYRVGISPEGRFEFFIAGD